MVCWARVMMGGFLVPEQQVSLWGMFQWMEDKLPAVEIEGGGDDLRTTCQGFRNALGWWGR